MSYRRLRLLAVPVIVLVATGLAATSVAGQPGSSDAARRAVPPTAWGDPDLQGTWASSGATPMERPDEHQGRERLSDEEVAQIRAESAARTERLLLAEARRTVAGGNVASYNNFWNDRGAPTNRTSMLVDPPDGRVSAVDAGRGDRPRTTDPVETTRGRTGTSGNGVSRAAGCPTPCSLVLQQQRADFSDSLVGRHPARAGP